MKAILNEPLKKLERDLKTMAFLVGGTVK